MAVQIGKNEHRGFIDCKSDETILASRHCLALAEENWQVNFFVRESFIKMNRNLNHGTLIYNLWKRLPILYHLHGTRAITPHSEQGLETHAYPLCDDSRVILRIFHLLLFFDGVFILILSIYEFRDDEGCDHESPHIYIV